MDDQRKAAEEEPQDIWHNAVLCQTTQAENPWTPPFSVGNVYSIYIDDTAAPFYRDIIFTFQTSGVMV